MKRLLHILVSLVFMASWPLLAQQKEAPVSPDLVFAERYLEKGWYREAWELLEPMIREGRGSGARMYVAAAEAAYGLDRIGDAMDFTEQIRSQQLAVTPEQQARIDALEAKVRQRCGTLVFQWPDEDDADAESVKRTEKFALEWADTKVLSESDEEAFRQVYQIIGSGITDGTKVYLPRGRVSVNGIWKDIGDEPAVFKVAKEKPPALQRVASGDGLGLSVGLQLLPGYQGTDYSQYSWTNPTWDAEGTAVGIGSRRLGMFGGPNFTLSVTHSLISQGWREVGVKIFFGITPGVGAAEANVSPEEELDGTLPEPGSFFALGAMARQSFRERSGFLIAGAAGAQGIYTPRMRVAVVGDVAEEGQSCTDAPDLDTVAVDRNTVGVGFLGSVEASRSIDAVAARVGMEVTAGYNLLSPMRASSVNFEGNPEGQQICFEDVDKVIGGWDLRTQLFFRMAVW